MIHACLQERRPFGVVLIKEGQEVGQPARPYAVGTTARIHDVERLDRGRLRLLTLGERRFHIRRVVQEAPYLAAEVVELDEALGDPAALRVATSQAVQLFSQYCQLLVRLGARESCMPELAPDPVTLSYQIGAWLQVDLEEKQALLEAPSTLERLTAALRLLRRERPLLERLAGAQGPAGSQARGGVERRQRGDGSQPFFSAN